MENLQTVQASRLSLIRSLPFSFWLSWQELIGRKAVFFINVILIAFLIALPVSLDYVGNARKSSVENRIDYIGPSLILVPQGIFSSDLMTAQLRGRTFEYSIFNYMKGRFWVYVRNMEVRLTERLIIEGRDTPVIGIDFRNVYSYPFTQYSPDENEILLGSVAAEKLNKDRGEVVRILSRDFTVAGIIPTTGGIEDVSVFLPLPVLQKLSQKEGRINEIRFFTLSSALYEQLKTHLRTYSGSLNMIDSYRGDRAEKDIGSALVTYQKALYTAAFILIALCVMISTYINLDARKIEVSTVYTLGAAKDIIFKILTFRTVWITLLGSVIGQLIALLVTMIQAPHVPLRFIWSAASSIEVIAGTVCLGMAVTIPFALYSVYRRDPVSDL